MLKKIRLELARSHEFPEGSPNHGYEFTAPLSGDGKIDAEEWHRQRERCKVGRFRPGEADDVGHLVRRPGGSWAFHYDVLSDEEDDGSGYRFGDHAFRSGEYVSVKEEGHL
ncbi:MAG: hypothetical protein FJX63_10140 [Alphaproteobacteria bacterium]|nr:hypothetical protein [Alphaproteobacteria bacterium]